MSINDPLPDRGTDSQAHPAVKNLILLALAVPPLLVLWAVGVAAVGVGYRTARYGTLPDLSGLSTALSSDLVLLGVAAALVYIYLVWANAVFGTSTVEAAQEQAQEIKDTAEDETGD